jgi:hypothetical protein
LLQRCLNPTPTHRALVFDAAQSKDAKRTVPSAALQFLPSIPLLLLLPPLLPLPPPLLLLPPLCVCVSVAAAPCHLVAFLFQRQPPSEKKIN